MSEKQDQKDGSARAPSNRNDAHDHVGTLRTIMLEKVRIIVGIRTLVTCPLLIEKLIASSAGSALPAKRFESFSTMAT
jgi:hypothetical protein